jgi:hypothetical protein
LKCETFKLKMTYLTIFWPLEVVVGRLTNLWPDRRHRRFTRRVEASAPTASLLGRACERPPRILGGQKNLDGAIGAARLNAADQGFLAGIFIGVGETLAVAGDEI